jgi:hypothetical protein
MLDQAVRSAGGLVLQVDGQSRIDDTADRPMTVERFGGHKRACAMRLHPLI